MLLFDPRCERHEYRILMRITFFSRSDTDIPVLNIELLKVTTINQNLKRSKYFSFLYNDLPTYILFKPRNGISIFTQLVLHQFTSFSNRSWCVQCPLQQPKMWRLLLRKPVLSLPNIVSFIYSFIYSSSVPEPWVLKAFLFEGTNRPETANSRL